MLTPRICAAALVLLVGSITPAGTVIVQVRDDHGAVVADQRLYLHAPGGGGDNPWSIRNQQRHRGITDRDGRAVFPGLPPGPYTVTLRSLNDPTLVDPADNPFAPPPTGTLVGEQDVLVLDVELWHGVTVICRVDVEHGKLRHTAVQTRELDRDFTRTTRLTIGSDHELALVPGRWALSLGQHAGYLLTAVEVDGSPIEGNRAVVELRPAAAPRHVRWQLSAPALVWGQVDFEGPPEQATVVAELTEPGAWIEEAQQRGDMSFLNPHGGVDPRDGRYSVELPDGSWKLRVVGDSVLETEPEFAAVELMPGENRRVDFLVRTDESKGLPVRVVRPDGRSARQATVEVWPPGALEKDRRPLRRVRAPWGFASIRLEAGEYELVASHADYLEGVARVTYDPEQAHEQPFEIRLRPGAEVHALATNEAQEPVPAVHLALQRLDDDRPRPRLTDAAIRHRILNPETTTDDTGHAWLRGVWPGRYRLRGSWRAGRRHGFVRFHDGRRLHEELEIDVTDAQRHEVDVRVLPAADVAASLHCVGDEPLPGSVSFAALPAGFELSELGESAVQEQAVLFLEDVPLRGDRRDRLSAGPLREGAHYVAVRPAGHDRWTWALGTERVVEASLVQTELGEQAELGTLEIDCGPAVRITPRAVHGDPLPDLREVRPDLETLIVRGQVTGPEGAVAVERVRADAYPEQLMLRGLPEGQADLEIVLRHPHFLPRPQIRARVLGPLRPGRTLGVAPGVPGVGGALRVNSRHAVAVRVTATAREESRHAVLADGEVIVPSLPAGVYRVDYCGDADCRQVLQVREPVVIEQRRTTSLADRVD